MIEYKKNAAAYQVSLSAVKSIILKPKSGIARTRQARPARVEILTLLRQKIMANTAKKIKSWILIIA